MEPGRARPQRCQLRDKVATIQNRTRRMLDRSAVALTDMLDAIRAAKAHGINPGQEKQLDELYANLIPRVR